MRASFHAEDRRFSLGPFLKAPYPEIVECCGIAGFDFAIADMEHTPVGPRELLPLLLAAQARGISLIVRIPENLPMYFKWCLDLGIQYIQVPHVQSGEDARWARRSSQFGASGDRGLCRFVRAAGYSSLGVEDYLAEANRAVKLILQVEGTRAIENLDDILMTEGLDTVFIGPYDLSQSLGRPGEIWHPAVVSAMSDVIAKCRKARVRVGTFADSPEGIRNWVSQGVEMIQFASDLNLLLAGIGSVQAGFRETPGREH